MENYGSVILGNCDRRCAMTFCLLGCLQVTKNQQFLALVGNKKDISGWQQEILKESVSLKIFMFSACVVIKISFAVHLEMINLCFEVKFKKEERSHMVCWNPFWKLLLVRLFNISIYTSLGAFFTAINSC